MLAADIITVVVITNTVTPTTPSVPVGAVVNLDAHW